MAKGLVETIGVVTCVVDVSGRADFLEIFRGERRVLQLADFDFVLGLIAVSLDFASYAKFHQL